MTQIVSVINSSPALDYASHIAETCKNLQNFNSQHIKLSLEFAHYVYQQVEMSIRLYGKTIRDIAEDISEVMAKKYKPVSYNEIIYTYYTVQFLIDIKFQDKLAYDRIMKMIENGTIKLYHVKNIASSNIRMREKLKAIGDITSNNSMSNKEVIKLIKAYKKENIGCVPNFFDKLPVSVSFRHKYLSPDAKIYLPFPIKEEKETDAIVETYHEYCKFEHGSDYNYPDNEFDGCLLFLPNFQAIKSNTFTCHSFDEFFEKLDKQIQECYRVTKLDGMVGVASWNKLQYGEQRIDVNQNVYKCLEQYGDWHDTSIIPFPHSVRYRNPMSAYRVLHVFRKR